MPQFDISETESEPTLANSCRNRLTANGGGEMGELIELAAVWGR